MQTLGVQTAANLFAVHIFLYEPFPYFIVIDHRGSCYDLYRLCSGDVSFEDDNQEARYTSYPL